MSLSEPFKKFNEMSSYSFNIQQQFPQHPIPVLIYQNARAFYKSFIEIFGKTLLLVFIFLTSIIWYFPLFISLYITNRKVNKTLKAIQEINISGENYGDLYSLYQKVSDSMNKFHKNGESKKIKTNNLLLKPLFKQLNKFVALVNETNDILEDKLFQNAEELNISDADANKFLDQLNRSPHDWEDDDIWADFQIEHNHLK